ncbi:hypothetical protein [Palaeococcus ferrophilus]|uniref:hypothetical protein n=1 Tax=Palaeococcus ferrophilus TaxID=83868 RepID=UPI000A3F7EFC|nr:hypothetical protein [Palaeococcus ferrophilus]
MLRLELYCAENEGEKVSEILSRWKVQFYVEEVRGSGEVVLRFTALVPEFAINDLVDELMKSVDLRRVNSSITWAPVSGRSVKYSNSVRALQKFRGRWTMADIEGLVEKANRQAEVDPIQLTLGAVASIIALFGLINESVVMIISAMLLSPILGPLYGFSLNIVMGKGRTEGCLLHSKAPWGCIHLIPCGLAPYEVSLPHAARSHGGNPREG